MGRIDDSFQRFHGSLTLTEGMKQQISERLQAMQGFLQGTWRTPEVLPIGSYARGTIVPPVKDADVLFVHAAGAPGRDAAQVLREVNAALAQRYGATRVQRHSVQVRFEDFAIDVVPACGGDGRYYIPELKEHGDPSRGGAWIETTPRAQDERVRRANGTHGGFATRLIATLKHMNQGHGTRLKSFHLETMVLDRLEHAQGSGQTFAEVLPGWLDARAGHMAASGEAYLTVQTRAEIGQRYRNDAATMREALTRDDVALARKVVPGLP